MTKKQQREYILMKFGGKCSYCGTNLIGTKWHADHANPVERKLHWNRNKKRYDTKGFHKPENDNLDNMMPSCASCNINKHSLDIEGFRRFIGRFVDSLNRDSVQYKIAKRYGLIEETGKPVLFYYETL